ncbi:tetratricopeptide repeat protein [Desulfococcaceae bacterium HSG8]|nr:tetratricopeptide repeat protein [Desulfococcaceae bacterium HSG8]
MDKRKLFKGILMFSIGVLGLSLALMFSLGILITTKRFFIKGGDNDEAEPTPQAFIEQARTYTRHKNTWNAVIEYKNAIHLDPENDTAYFELAENYVLRNSIRKAIKAYQTAVTINPKNKYANLRLGQIYLETGKLPEAKETISAILATDPQAIEAYHLLSSIQIRERHFDEAIETLKKAVLISEKNIKTKLALASLYEASSKQDLAEAMYKNALAIAPSQREPYMKLCKLYRKDKAWDKMEALLLQVLETPEMREAKLTDLARFYEGQKKYSTAETYYKRAADESPQSVQALMNLAEFHTRRKDRRNAIVTMKKTVNLEPDNPKCLAGLAQVYLAFGMPEFSDYVIGKAQKIEESDLDVVFTEGKLIMKRGNFKLANAYLSWIIEEGFINADAYYSRAMCIKHQASPDDPRREEMKKDLQAALLIEPGMLRARMEMIEIYLHEKGTAKAEEYLCFAFRQSPRNPRLLILLAALRILQKNRDAAREIYTSIVEQNPSYIPGHLRLALLYTASGKIDQAVRSYLRAYETDHRQLSILKKISDILVSEKHYKKAMEFLNSAKIPKDKISQAFVENQRGEISVKAGEKNKAINFFQASAALDPAAITPKMNMARVFMDNKQMEKAKAIYMEAERANPDHMPILTALGIIHTCQGDMKVAESYYRRILAINDRHVYASNNLAYLLAEANRGTSEALVLAGIARDKRPYNPDVLDTIGWVYYQKGFYLYAIIFFKESLDLKPDNPIACYHLGMALSKNNESEKARPYFEKALSLDHDFKHAEEVRNMLK